MENQISGIIRTCMYYLNWIRKIRPYLTVDATKILVQCCVINRIDYCNALLVSLPKTHLSHLQRVMNIAAMLIFQKPRDYSITELLKKLHWLKVKDRIAFKVLCLTWQSLNNSAPSYILCLLIPSQPGTACKVIAESWSSTFRNPAQRTVIAPFAIPRQCSGTQYLLPFESSNRFLCSNRKLKTLFFSENRTVNRYQL